MDDNPVKFGCINLLHIELDASLDGKRLLDVARVAGDVLLFLLEVFLHLLRKLVKTGDGLGLYLDFLVDFKDLLSAILPICQPLLGDFLCIVNGHIESLCELFDKFFSGLVGYVAKRANELLGEDLHQSLLCAVIEISRVFPRGP